MYNKDYRRAGGCLDAKSDGGPFRLMLSLRSERHLSNDIRGFAIDCWSTSKGEPMAEQRKVVTAEPENSETPLDGVRSWVTPTRLFFVRNHFAVPTMDLAAWRLTVEGRVKERREWTWEELMDLPERHRLRHGRVRRQRPLVSGGAAGRRAVGRRRRRPRRVDRRAAQARAGTLRPGTRRGGSAVRGGRRRHRTRPSGADAVRAQPAAGEGAAPRHAAGDLA